jgi:hypothetical protein
LIYPTEKQIQEFMSGLPAELIEEFKPVVEEAQRRYRRTRLASPGDEKALIGVLSDLAAFVFKRLASRRLAGGHGDPEQFKRAISVEGGDAETATWFAYDLYRISGDGVMLKIWAREIQSKLWDLIRQADDIWWLPGLVPQGWEKFLNGEPTMAPPEPGSSAELNAIDAREKVEAKERNPEDLARVRQKVVMPLLKHRGWSISQWAIESEVDFHTANDYLDGDTTPRASTRLRLAKALGIPVEILPE